MNWTPTLTMLSRLCWGRESDATEIERMWENGAERVRESEAARCFRRETERVVTVAAWWGRKKLRPTLHGDRRERPENIVVVGEKGGRREWDLCWNFRHACAWCCLHVRIGFYILHKTVRFVQSFVHSFVRTSFS